MCVNTPEKVCSRQRNPPFDDIKLLGVYFKGLEMIFRHFWDFSGCCPLKVHLENQILDWGDLNELLAKLRESFPSILLHNAEAVTPPSTGRDCTSLPSRLIHGNPSSQHYNPRNREDHKILLRQKLNE